MNTEHLLSRCLLLDLETTNAGKLCQVGAVFQERCFLRLHPEHQIPIPQILRELDDFACQAEFVLGHNLFGHDLEILHALMPALNLLNLSVIDTLYLSPLAFPQNPYHHLVKDYKLVRSALSDPIEDAKLAAAVFRDHCREFETIGARNPALLEFYAWCFRDASFGPSSGQGMAEVFDMFGGPAALNSQRNQVRYFESAAAGQVCQTVVHTVVDDIVNDPALRPMLAYCLAWILVAGSNSVLPSWVRYQFPKIVDVLQRLREQPCGQPNCEYCREHHDPLTQLTRFFGFPAFRDSPQTESGESLQQAIVTCGMAGWPLLAILPTGGGKSLCFQLPALARHKRRGLLTVVISPLQALMKDQVDNLVNKTGTPFADAIYGMLTPPERGAALERVRQGDVAILYISPEQLRNRSVRRVLQQREIGCWVFDEAHCLSKWGHDFRPDYLYAARFIREFSAEQGVPIAPVACFTATAKQDVIDEILQHFRQELQQDLQVFAGGVERDNLTFEIQVVKPPEKPERIVELLTDHFAPHNTDAGCAIIYASTRRKTEELRDYLVQHGFVAESFHAGLDSQLKRMIIEEFVAGRIAVICATNAFGMGIDKEDVRLVVHYDIPGSLENYLQEAGRAGRDRKPAHCVLFYDPKDVEQQFSMGSLSEVRKREIERILRGLRRAKKNQQEEIVLTVAELLRDDDLVDLYEEQDRMKETKVKTAIAWLERAGFMERNENFTQVFQGTPRVKNLAEANALLSRFHLHPVKQNLWLAVLRYILNATPDEGLSADDIAEGLFQSHELEQEIRRTGKTAAQTVMYTLHEMAEAGVIDRGVLLTAFVRTKGKHNARTLFTALCALEDGMIKLMQELEPDADDGQYVDLNLLKLNQRLCDEGFESNQQILLRLLKSLSYDGTGLSGAQGSLKIMHPAHSHYYYKVKLQRTWAALRKTAELRRAVAQVILGVLLEKAAHTSSNVAQEDGSRALVPFSSNELTAAIGRDLFLRAELRDMLAAIDRALMFLHEQNVITIQHGLAIFRQAMTIRLAPEAKGRRYAKGDYKPLADHYGERRLQVHVINEYARLGWEYIQKALKLVLDYFSMERLEFVKTYFRNPELLQLATSRESYQQIVECLGHPVQMSVVASPPDDNMLILAGPGAGKTNVVVHRCAFLLRAERIPARQILILCFNHNAAVSLRKRLYELVGDDARGVTVLTYHGLALRLTGHSLADAVAHGGAKHADDGLDFEQLIRDATALLQGRTDLTGLEPDEVRDRLLAGYSHILVDEYQDIDDDQYALVSALAGRTLEEGDGKLAILAVGDDDQNVYTFRGTNVQFIRKFQEDYPARVLYLVENYRSSAHIIAAANALIAANRDRMKTEHPIRINKARQYAPAGGIWTSLDPLTQGRVQALVVEDEYQQAVAVVDELQRLKRLSPTLAWQDCAVLTRTRKTLDPIRARCEQIGLPVRWGLESSPPLHRVREIARFLEFLQASPKTIVKASDLIERVVSRQERPALSYVSISGRSDSGGTLSGNPDAFQQTCVREAARPVYLDVAENPREHPNPWNRLLLELLENYKDETLDAALPAAQAIDWFYESLAEERREKMLGHGIFLSTIHAAKGMEFAHVFVSGSDWRTQQNPARQEEERRLLYVGMTRAQQTLCLFTCRAAPHPFLPTLRGDFLFQRPASHSQRHDTDMLHTRYSVLGLKDVYLDYAGVFPEHHPIHHHLTQLGPGHFVRLIPTNTGISVHDLTGVCVAKLSKSAANALQAKLAAIRTVRVLGLIQRKAADSEEGFQSRLRMERWEVPILEIVSVESRTHPS